MANAKKFDCTLIGKYTRMSIKICAVMLLCQNLKLIFAYFYFYFYAKTRDYTIAHVSTLFKPIWTLNNLDISK